MYERFVFERTIEHFNRLLLSAVDLPRTARLQSLLAAECVAPAALDLRTRREGTVCFSGLSSAVADVVTVRLDQSGQCL